MSGLNIHKMSGQVGHEKYNFRCNDVVKPLPGPPHPLLNMLKEAVNFMKIVTCLAMCIPWPGHVAQNVKDTIFVRYCLIGQIKNQVKFMNISTEHILQRNQSDPLADASGRIVDLMIENAATEVFLVSGYLSTYIIMVGLIYICVLIAEYSYIESQ